MNKEKIVVGVVYGGKSGEHEISLQSAASVIQALDPELFQVIPVGIDKCGQWYLNRLPEVLLPSATVIAVKGEHSRAIPVPSYAHVEGCLRCDVIFPVVHGPLYEDGALQGLLQIADIPYVGSGVLASAIAMDKDVTHRLLHVADIPVVPHVALSLGEWRNQAEVCCEYLLKQLSLPVFVKPARLGSSVGTIKVDKVTQLNDAIKEAFRYDTKIIVEKAIDAREIELSVLENLEYGELPLVSIPGEIEIGNKHAFYSYEAKYLDPNGAALVIPAILTQEQIEQFKTYARKAFTALNAEGMARCDFFLDRDSGKIYLNELNTIPGFTSISMYPKLWQASGLSYRDLLTRLVYLALARHERERQIVRDWVGASKPISESLK